MFQPSSANQDGWQTSYAFGCIKFEVVLDLSSSEASVDKLIACNGKVGTTALHLLASAMAGCQFWVGRVSLWNSNAKKFLVKYGEDYKVFSAKIDNVGGSLEDIQWLQQTCTTFVDWMGIARPGDLEADAAKLCNIIRARGLAICHSEAPESALCEAVSAMAQAAIATFPLDSDIADLSIEAGMKLASLTLDTHIARIRVTIDTIKRFLEGNIEDETVTMPSVSPYVSDISVAINAAKGCALTGHPRMKTLATEMDSVYLKLSAVVVAPAAAEEKLAFITVCNPVLVVFRTVVSKL